MIVKNDSSYGCVSLNLSRSIRADGYAGKWVPTFPWGAWLVTAILTIYHGQIMAQGSH